jgi:hypothetical protein
MSRSFDEDGDFGAGASIATAHLLDNVEQVVAIIYPAAGGDLHGLLDELLGSTPRRVHVDVEWTHGIGDAE